GAENGGGEEIQSKQKKSRPYYAFKSRDTFGPKVKIKSNLTSRDTRTGQWHGAGSIHVFVPCIFVSMYIRVKRTKTIYFMQCDPTETVLNVKQTLLTLSEQPSYKSASGLNVY
ncbi:unnamed protein product, partial [Brassica oleracea var. botrytis]